MTMADRYPQKSSFHKNNLLQSLRVVVQILIGLLLIYYDHARKINYFMNEKW